MNELKLTATIKLDILDVEAYATVIGVIREKGIKLPLSQADTQILVDDQRIEGLEQIKECILAVNDLFRRAMTYQLKWGEDFLVSECTFLTINEAVVTLRRLSNKEIIQCQYIEFEMETGFMPNNEEMKFFDAVLGEAYDIYANLGDMSGACRYIIEEWAENGGSAATTMVQCAGQIQQALTEIEGMLTESGSDGKIRLIKLRRKGTHIVVGYTVERPEDEIANIPF